MFLCVSLSGKTKIETYARSCLFFCLARVSLLHQMSNVFDIFPSTLLDMLTSAKQDLANISFVKKTSALQGTVMINWKNYKVSSSQLFWNVTSSGVTKKL